MSSSPSTNTTTTIEEFQEFLSFLFDQHGSRLEKRCSNPLDDQHKTYLKPLLNPETNVSELSDYLKKYKNKNPQGFGKIIQPQIDRVNRNYLLKLRGELSERTKKSYGKFPGTYAEEIVKWAEIDCKLNPDDKLSTITTNEEILSQSEPPPLEKF